MKASIVIIGDEILLGQVTDTNSGEIARALGPMGWEIVTVRVVGDTAGAIKGAIDSAMAEADLVITTGGLGPTKDDITKRVLLDIFGGELREDPDVLANVEDVFARRGLALNDLTRSQALVPTSCRVIQNVFGTAPIMWFEADGKVLISMPGVPFETVGMLRKSVLGLIAERFTPGEQFLHKVFIVRGITESDLAERLAHYEASLPVGMHLAYLPNPGYIRLRLDSNAPFAGKDEELRQAIADVLVHDGDATPAEILLEKVRAKGFTVATAESCTGGNIAHSITAIAGCSDCYVGSVVSYANEVKSNVLGVNMADIEACGAVSEQVARQMAEGACRALGADCAVATTGIAGPGGAVLGKPVGTVWMAAHTPAGTVARLYHFPGNRQRVIDRATAEALFLLSAQLS